MRQFQIRTGLEEHEHTLCEKHSLFPGLFSSLFTLCYINLDCLLKNAFPFICFAYFKDKSGVRNRYDLLFCPFDATSATNEANFVKTDWIGCDGLLGIQKDAGKGVQENPN